MRLNNAANVMTLATLLYSKNTEGAEEKKGTASYREILEVVVQKISSDHSKELAEGLYEKDTKVRLKNLINKYLISEKLVENETSIGDLADRIYEDMAGIGFIKKYLEDKDAEEININGKDDVWVVYGDKKVKIKEKWDTAEDCINVVKKMARMGGLILDKASPVGDSYLSKGVRMSAAISPAVDPETGAIASIRKQKPSFITRQNIIDFGTASNDELDFLTCCLNNRISIAIAGATGAGKTADLNFLLNSINPEIRVVTIEDTKELLPEGRDVVQLYTKEPPNPVTMEDELKLCLRLHPELLIPAEMRGKEAVTAIEAARTGHTALTSLHANGAQNAYYRILSMYRQGDSNLSEETILKMIVEAFPIILYKRQLEDNSRKYIEIFEATGVDANNNIEGTTIFSFVPEETIRDENGKILKINGRHERKGDISQKLAELMILSGENIEEVRRWRKEFAI